MKQSLFDAFKCYNHSGFQKSPLACVKLGLCYERGYGVGQDYREAALWYQRGAQVREKTCLAALGRFHEEGLGMRRNVEEAAKYYLQAAEQGEPFAQLSLGTLYRKGQGVRQDNVSAYVWLSLAARQGLGAQVRELLAQGMTPEQIAAAEKRLAELPPSLTAPPSVTSTRSP